MIASPLPQDFAMPGAVSLVGLAVTLASLLIALCLYSSPATAANRSDNTASVPASSLDQARLFDSAVRRQAIDLLGAAKTNTSDVMIARMRGVAEDATLDPIQRDATLYDFVRRLRDSPPWTVEKTVLSWLKQYTPQALRPHEKSPAHMIPLFDVAAAATGLHNQWLFESAAIRIRSADSSTLTELLEHFAEQPDGAHANGLRAALPQLPGAMLDQLAGACHGHPLLEDRLLPHIDIARGRVEEVSARIAVSDVEQASELLLGANRWLDPADALAVQRAALHHPLPEVKALAMTQLTEQVTTRPELQREWATELLALVSDPELGGAASLQLTRLPEHLWLARLKDQAVFDHHSARRLELIVELQRSDEPQR